MIAAEIVGGPHDGERWALPSPNHDFVCTSYALEDEVREVRIHPTLTRDGWRLFWREP